jgi:hypothetical protein
MKSQNPEIPHLPHQLAQQLTFPSLFTSTSCQSLHPFPASNFSHHIKLLQHHQLP